MRIIIKFILINIVSSLPKKNEIKNQFAIRINQHQFIIQNFCFEPNSAPHKSHQY